MTQTLKPDGAGQNSSAPKSKTDQTASSETIRERLMREISENPRFTEAPISGKGFVIGGAKP
jgi:hypothetical protein